MTCISQAWGLDSAADSSVKAETLRGLVRVLDREAVVMRTLADTLRLEMQAIDQPSALPQAKPSSLISSGGDGMSARQLLPGQVGQTPPGPFSQLSQLSQPV